MTAPRETPMTDRLSGDVAEVTDDDMNRALRETGSGWGWLGMPDAMRRDYLRAFALATSRRSPAGLVAPNAEAVRLWPAVRPFLLTGNWYGATHRELKAIDGFVDALDEMENPVAAGALKSCTDCGLTLGGDEGDGTHQCSNCLGLRLQGGRAAAGAVSAPPPDTASNGNTIGKVTRFEVIDHRQKVTRGQSGQPDPRGRVFSASNNVKVNLSYQDDGKTLKVFVEDR